MTHTDSDRRIFPGRLSHVGVHCFYGDALWLNDKKKKVALSVAAFGSLVS